MSLKFYREAMLFAKNFPVVKLREKLARNVREVYELYKAESNPEKIQRLICNGRDDIQLLKDLTSVSPELTESLFCAFKSPKENKSFE